MKKQIVILDEDLECFKWLWRWKLLSTTAIKLGVYKSKNLEKAYRRLLHFQKCGYIIPYWSRDGKFCLWQLTEKSYEFLRINYEEEFVGGFKTENPNHDFWVTAIHLGDWIMGMPNGSFFSEQQLRRIDVDDYPLWVPHIRVHRPDGYWKLDLNQKNDKSLEALEVELSKKSPVSYNGTGNFYLNSIDVYHVLHPNK